MSITGNDHRQKVMTLAVSNKGFTLIELAVVLIIIGVILGMGAGLLGPLTKRAKYNKSEDIVNSAIESVLSYGASRNKLPVTGDFASTLSIPNDAYTKPLFYIVDSNLTDTTIGGICGRKTTNLTVKICPDLTCSSPTDTINNVGFIVLSGAGNYNNQTAGTEAFSSAETIKVFETDYVVDNYTGDMNRPEAYDDIVEWVGINELRTKVNCTGAALRIINNELPFTYSGDTYSASIFADGGVPFSSGGDYRWCRQESASSGLTFTPLTLSSNCLTEDEDVWLKGDDLAISGSSSTAGTYNFTFFVRDNNDSSDIDDNIAQRSLVLTVNPVVSTGTSCTDYRVWNDLSRKDFELDGSCEGRIRRNREITDDPILLNTGETVIRYNSNNNNCTSQIATLTFAEALAADTDEDCCVEFSGSDIECP